MRKQKILFYKIIVFLTLIILHCIPAAAQRLGSEKSLRTAKFRAAPNDLSFTRVVDLKTGVVFRVYYDEKSVDAAAAAVPVLAAFYRNLSLLLNADAGSTEWASAVFTQNPNYVSPRLCNEVRWKVKVEENGTLGSVGLEDLYVTIPHEQAHSIQKTYFSDLPRWFAEGQANWAGLKVTSQWKPELAKKHRDFLSDSRRELTVPVNLSGWGAVRIKREAVLRQVTPEVRARMEKDPNYEASGPFTFTQDDFTSDESNLAARYFAALEIFELMEKSAPQGIRNLNGKLWKLPETPDTEKLSVMIKQLTNYDVVPQLK